LYKKSLYNVEMYFNIHVCGFVDAQADKKSKFTYERINCRMK